MLRCECEHIAHFESDKRTPNGNPGHKYGTMFLEDFLVQMSCLNLECLTVCKDCQNDCYKNEEG